MLRCTLGNISINRLKFIIFSKAAIERGLEPRETGSQYVSSAHVVCACAYYTPIQNFTGNRCSGSVVLFHHHDVVHSDITANTN